MSDANSTIEELALVNFDVDEFLNKEAQNQVLRLPPWSDPDQKILDYQRRLEKHRVLRDDYHKRFIEYKILLKRTRTGEKERKPPTKSFYDFAEKVCSNINRVTDEL